MYIFTVFTVESGVSTVIIVQIKACTILLCILQRFSQLCGFYRTLFRLNNQSMLFFDLQFHVLKTLKMPSVNEFVKRITASEKFLKSIASLPNYKEVERLQYQKLEDFLSNCKWNEEEVAQAITAVSLAATFSDSSRKKFQMSMAHMCSSKEEVKARKGPSSSQQDYSTLHRFLVPSVWKDLSHEDVLHRTHALCRFASRLGLSQPTELTLRTLLCCVFWRSWAVSATSPGEKYRLGQGLKPTIRQVLKQHLDQPEHLRLDKLPPTVEELPATHAEIFATEFLVLNWQSIVLIV